MHKLLAAVTVLAVSTAGADIIYVDVNCPGPGNGSETEPYCSIQVGINNASDGDEVVVAPGTYLETINFLGMAITLRSSDGAEVTTIHANGPPGADTAVTCDSSEGPDTVLEGFTITGGTGTLFEKDPGMLDVVGGGMFNTNSSSPTVTNCTFCGNSAEIGGGMANATDSSPTVTNCTFSENSALGDGGSGGGMSSINNNFVVTNCVFSGNTAALFGGGMDYDNCSPTITNCTFNGNSTNGDGGGMALYGNSRPTIINCTFSGNFANSAGAMYIDGADPTVINCTFSGNTARNGNALGFDFGGPSELVMTNCILWDGGDEIWNSDGSAITINYTDVQGGWSGTGNIDADPLFVDAAGGDLRLLPGSPCIDAGHNWAVAPDFADLDADGDTAELTPFDLDGNPRFVADPADFDPGCGIPAVVDMGAYEFQIGGPFDIRLGDIDGDGVVGINDFLDLLAAWGACIETCCLADLDIDGDVGITDFLLLLGNWG